MTALTAKTNISGTPTRATANAGFGALWDFINERLGAGGASDVERAASLAALGIAVPRGWIDGLKLSTAGSSATMTIGAGQAADSAATRIISLASSISKTTSAWTVGSAVGGLDSGTIANNTWYYFYLIRRPDTGVVDVVFSVNASAPTLPTNYTQYRYIGAGLTNGSGQWTSFVQDGDRFQWLSPVLDVAAASSGTSAVSRTLSVPRRNVVALLTANISVTGGSTEVAYLSDLAVTDSAPSNTAAPGGTLSVPNGQTLAAHLEIRTNTSGQIRSRQVLGGATETLRIFTRGWIDTRGKDA